MNFLRKLLSGQPSQERSDSSLSGSRMGEERKCGSCGRTFVDKPLEIEDLGVVGVRKRFRCPFCQTTMNYYDRP